MFCSDEKITAFLIQYINIFNHKNQNKQNKKSAVSHIISQHNGTKVLIYIVLIYNKILHMCLGRADIREINALLKYNLLIQWR